MGRTARFNKKMNFDRTTRIVRPKRITSLLENDESIIDIKSRLKRKAKCIIDYVGITIGRVYKIDAEFESSDFDTGKCIVIINDNNETKGYDSSVFEYIYEEINFDKPIEVIPQPQTKSIKSPVKFRGNTLRSSFKST